MRAEGSITRGRIWPAAALRTLLHAALLFGGVSAASIEQAQAQGLCQEPEAVEINKQLQYLRRLSLDLRGQMPSMEEYQQVVDEGEVSEAMIHAMIDSEDFLHQMRRYHQDLMSVDLSLQRFTGSPLREFTFADGTTVWGQSNGGNRRSQRGWRDAVEGQGVCMNQKVTLQAPLAGEGPGEDGKLYPKDGWVEVTPWWDRSTTIKVCAFDAFTQATAEPRGKDADLYYKGGTVDTSKVFGGYGPSANPVDCEIAGSSVVGMTRACGCGPNLKWCSSTPSQTMLRDAVVEQILTFTDDIISNDRPYTDLIQSKTFPYNGPLLHWMENLSFKGGTLLISDRDQGLTEVPTIGSDKQDVWREATRNGQHAGVLTSPFYLLKWQTNRGRANAFYNIFLCNSFSPPTDGLPSADHPSVNEPNLTHRDGCDTCHRALEPMASYWGHWAEGGYLPLGKKNTTNAVYSDLSTQNASCQMDESCKQSDTWRCAKTNAERQTCRFFYQTGEAKGAKGDAYNGYLNAYVFADVDVNAPDNKRPCDWTKNDCGYTAHLRQGPAKLAQNVVESGEFASCATRRFWGHFIGRDMTRSERVELLPEISQAFVDDNYVIKHLIFNLVTRPEYRDATWAGLE